MPRNPSLSFKNVSASSISKVGCQPSTTRRFAAGVMLNFVNGRRTNRPSTSSNSVLPHPFVAERMPSRGEMTKQSISQSCRTHSAATWLDVFDMTTWRRIAAAIVLSSAAPSTGSGHALGSGNSDRAPPPAIILHEPKLLALGLYQPIEYSPADAKL